jgi:hypothetical protein
MEIQTKYKVIVVIVALASSYAAGRWASPTKVVTEIKTVEVEKKTDKTATDTKSDDHKKITIVEVQKPDGEKQTTTTITQDTSTNNKTTNSQTDSNSTTTDDKHLETHSESKVTISALGGYDVTRNSPVYGLSCSKPILGPLTVGVFGLSNMTFGASVGLTF